MIQHHGAHPIQRHYRPRTLNEARKTSLINHLLASIPGTIPMLTRAQPHAFTSNFVSASYAEFREFGVIWICWRTDVWQLDTLSGNGMNPTVYLWKTVRAKHPQKWCLEQQIEEHCKESIAVLAGMPSECPSVRKPKISIFQPKSS